MPFATILSQQQPVSMPTNTSMAALKGASSVAQEFQLAIRTNMNMPGQQLTVEGLSVAESADVVVNGPLELLSDLDLPEETGEKFLLQAAELATEPSSIQATGLSVGAISEAAHSQQQPMLEEAAQHQIRTQVMHTTSEPAQEPELREVNGIAGGGGQREQLTGMPNSLVYVDRDDSQKREHIAAETRAAVSVVKPQSAGAREPLNEMQHPEVAMVSEQAGQTTDLLDAEQTPSVVKEHAREQLSSVTTERDLTTPAVGKSIAADGEDLPAVVQDASTRNPQISDTDVRERGPVMPVVKDRPETNVQQSINTENSTDTESTPTQSLSEELVEGEVEIFQQNQNRDLLKATSEQSVRPVENKPIESKPVTTVQHRAESALEQTDTTPADDLIVKEQASIRQATSSGNVSVSSSVVDQSGNQARTAVPQQSKRISQSERVEVSNATDGSEGYHWLNDNAGYSEIGDSENPLNSSLEQGPSTAFAAANSAQSANVNTKPEGSFGASFEIAKRTIESADSTKLAQSQETDSAQLEIDTPVQDDQWSQALAYRVQFMAQQGIQRAQVQLNPTELGPMEITIDVVDDVAQVKISAEHATTREAVEVAVPRLREMMAQSGFGETAVDLGNEKEQPASFSGDSQSRLASGSNSESEGQSRGHSRSDESETKKLDTRVTLGANDPVQRNEDGRLSFYV